MDDINTHTTPGTETKTEAEKKQEKQRAEYKKKYGKLCCISSTLTLDDVTEEEVEFYFKHPSTASYNRYIKTMSKNMMAASKAFLLDNVIEECQPELENALAEYPAMPIGFCDRLLELLGYSSQTNLKRI